MEKKIKVQIHDYDALGRYRITDEREVTKEEMLNLRQKAKESIKLDWDSLPETFNHVVYYAERLDKKGDISTAAIYMHGEALVESSFNGVFNQPDIGYVGAFHKNVPLGKI